MSSSSSVQSFSFTMVLPKGVFDNIANHLSLKDLGSLSLTEKYCNGKVNEILKEMVPDPTKVRAIYDRVAHAVGKETALQIPMIIFFQIADQIDRDTVTFANSLHSVARGGKEFSSASEACAWLTNPANQEQLQRVKVLDLSGKSIQYLPPEISRLRCLKALHIFDNKIRTLPPELGQLSELEFLHVQNNPLEALPSALSQLSLRKIDLRNTAFAQYPPILGALKDCEIVTDESFPAARGPLKAAVAYFFEK